MRLLSVSAAILTFIAGLVACAPRSGAPDFYAIMDRTIDMMLEMGVELEQKGLHSANEIVMRDFASRLQKSINKRPKLYGETMGLTLQKDGSLKGFSDPNRNNVMEIGEPMLFTLEIDAENERLVCTDYTGTFYGYRISGSGFFAGALVGSMRKRQQLAGVAPNRFAGAEINTKTRTAQASKPRGGAMRKASARSKARSGGARTGK